MAPGQARKQPPYRIVGPLERGLRILEVLSEYGWTTPNTLSNLTDINRASIYRLLHTMVESGFVAKRDGSYALTSKLSVVADGITQNELASQIVAPHLQELTKEIGWPCDYAVLLRGEVTIVESTHRISPMTTYRSMIGKKRPLMLSSLGAAMLSVLTNEELEITLNILEKLGHTKVDKSRLRKIANAIIHDIKNRGYAAADGTTDPKISAIALPIRTAHSPIGAVNIIFFRSAMTVPQAAERYLELLRACKNHIECEFTNLLALEEAEKLNG